MCRQQEFLKTLMRDFGISSNVLTTRYEPIKINQDETPEIGVDILIHYNKKWFIGKYIGERKQDKAECWIDNEFIRPWRRVDAWRYIE